MLRDRNNDDVAIYFAREGKVGVEQVTWGEVKERVRKTRGALAASGVRSRDVVAAVISNSVDAIVIALATLSLGAIWSSTSCDLGVAGIVDRYSQVSPKIIFADDGYIYAGKTINLAHRVEEWSNRLSQLNSNLTDVVIIPYCDLNPDLSRIAKASSFDAFLNRDTGAKLTFALQPFSHPAFILYSSGTVSFLPCLHML